MNDLLSTPAIPSVLLLAGVLYTGWVTLFKNRGDRAATVVDQWKSYAEESEERRKEDKTELLKALAEFKRESGESLAAVNHRLDQSIKRERVSNDYMWQLRNHIELGLGPPPPVWPQQLLARFPDE